MCEIFPEVDSCCVLINLRLSMLLISVFCVMTGVMGLSTVQQRTNASYDRLKNVTKIKNPGKMMSTLSNVIPTGLSGMSVVFMITGVILLFATLSDQEGFAQMFVWMTFINVLVGYVLVILVAWECVFHDRCLLSGMDWLSGSTFLVIIIGYLTMWIYFITVVNSHVVSTSS